MRYHVWSARDLAELVQYVGCEIVCEKKTLNQRPDSFAVVGRVLGGR